jgi:hypothetical protein
VIAAAVSWDYLDCMRHMALILLGMALLSVPPAAAPQPSGGTMHSRASGSCSTASHTTVDFNKQIRPILEQRCQPCHFAGGTMYGKLPFDRSATILSLGTKLFTRIRNEDQRALIRKFLEESGRSK